VRSLSADIQSAGGPRLTMDDLASFRAYGREPLAIPYRGGNVYATPELTCGPTLAHTLRLLQQRLQPGRAGPDGGGPTANNALGAAIGLFAKRLKGHGRRRRAAAAPRRRNISRRPAPRISRWWIRTATWRR